MDSNVPTSQLLDDATKAHLEEMLTDLNKNITILVQDASLIHNIFSVIKDNLPSDLMESLTPPAFMEGHQPQVLNVQNCLAKRASQESATASKEVHRQRAITFKAELVELESAPAFIDQEILSCRLKKPT